MFTRRALLISAATIPVLRGQISTPSCVLTPEQEEGPYYIDGAVVRKDLTEGKPGIPMTLRIALVDARRCAPLPSAAVDVWHCDAEGVYSGFATEGRGGRGRGPGPGGGMPPPGEGSDAFGPRMPPPPGGRGPRRTDKSRFLRGVQATNAQGMVEFGTIYPGWYEGRAIHIHLKAHIGDHVAHTGQLFFPEDVTERVARMAPYAKHANVRRTRQEEDGIFESEHGSSSMVRLERIGSASAPDRFIATVTLAVDPDQIPRPIRGRGGPPFA